MRWLREHLGGEAAYPVFALSFLNLVDEFDIAVFGLVGPEITQHFDISPATFGLAQVVPALLLIFVPVMVGWLGDRANRILLAVVGASVWCVFALLTGLVPTVVLLFLVRLLSGLGRSVSEPTHASLIADYYPMSGRGTAYAIHRNTYSVGSAIGAFGGGYLAQKVGWQTAFVLLPLPGILAILLVARLHEPKRGGHERAADDQYADLPEPLPLLQSVKLLRNIKSWTRFALVIMFLAAGLGITSILSFYLDATFGVGPFGRGLIMGAAAFLGIVGSLVGGVWGQRLIAKGDMRGAGGIMGWSMLISAVSLAAMAWAPTLPIAVFAAFVNFGFRLLATVPAYVIVSAVVPARIRGQAFGAIALFLGLGFATLPIFLSYGDRYSYRVSLILGVVPLLIGAVIAFDAAKYIASDIVRAGRIGAAEAEVRRRKEAGEAIDLLQVIDLDVCYGTVQVLFGVDLRIAEGETVALLGTNGAGKSTLLRAVSGLIRPTGGAVLFDGHDVTGIDAEATTALGIIHVPGGKGVFPGMSVRRNLELGTYLYRKDKQYTAEAYDRALAMFPHLAERLDQAAGSLSGGEQQMLSLAQAFMAKPRLLIIDELSIGLAPVVVEELLGTVERINATGVAVLLVEQSVNIALSLADRAYFLEKGEVRFEGPAAELLDHDDIVRSVFLAGARDLPELAPHGAK